MGSYGLPFKAPDRLVDAEPARAPKVLPRLEKESPAYPNLYSFLLFTICVLQYNFPICILSLFRDNKNATNLI